MENYHICDLKLQIALRGKCLYSEFFWSECGKILFSPNAGKCGLEKPEYGHFSRSVVDDDTYWTLLLAKSPSNKVTYPNFLIKELSGKNPMRS